MNITVFIDRFKKMRKEKYPTQNAFAEAYIAKFGSIRKSKTKKEDSDMFGTVQKWEQGRSFPTTDVLCNICELLDCDADYLLDKITEKTHCIEEMKKYTGLSEQALDALHNIPHITCETTKYKRILNSFITSGYFISFMEALKYLDDCFEKKEAIDRELIATLGKKLYKQAFNTYYHEPYETSELSKELCDAINKVSNAESKQYNLSYTEKIARYELQQTFDALILDLYPRKL